MAGAQLFDIVGRAADGDDAGVVEAVADRRRTGLDAGDLTFDQIVAELVEAGTVKAGAQPVVIVVREETPLPWPFGSVANDDDDD